MKKNKAVALLTIGCLTVSMCATPVFAADSSASGKKSAASASSKVYEVKYEEGRTNYFNQITEAMGNGGRTVVLEPGHTYHLSGMIRIPSNTTLIAKNTVIIEDKRGSTMISQPDKYRNNSSIKKYNAVHDITINGGTWIGTKKYAIGAVKKLGYYAGCNVVNFLHSRNITIKNGTFYNSYNAHIIEFAGCKNCKIINCNIGQKANGKKGFYKGAADNGAIQLDACTNASNNPQGKTFDGTACRNITIKNNNIYYVTGIECAQRTSKPTVNVKVKGNVIHYHYMPYITKHTKQFKKSGNKTIKY